MSLVPRTSSSCPFRDSHDHHSYRPNVRRRPLGPRGSCAPGRSFRAPGISGRISRPISNDGPLKSQPSVMASCHFSAQFLRHSGSITSYPRWRDDRMEMLPKNSTIRITVPSLLYFPFADFVFHEFGEVVKEERPS
jgi:hypothetical protein